MPLIAIQIFLIALAFMLGSSFASFMGVVIERVPKGENINGRSHCACGRQLNWYENIPVIGYVSILGKAKCCGAKLPPWYLFFEIALGAIFATIVGILVF